MLQLLKRKKRKRNQQLLLVDYNSLEEGDVISSVEEMQRRLLNVFKHHIGKANAITPSDLFEHVFRVKPHAINVYKREYWWNVLKQMLKKMRREDVLFVINQGHLLFVLQTQDEAELYKTRIQQNITQLEKIKIKADEWVYDEKWKGLNQE